MRKNELFKLYEESYNKIQVLSIQLEELKAENLRLKSKIYELESEKETVEEVVLEENFEETENIETKSEVEFLPETEFGARTIGRIVVLAAKHCNAITSIGENKENKELVNLILGRTEVAKAEILKIVSLECEFEVKREMILREETATEDYFMSVRAQI